MISFWKKAPHLFKRKNRELPLVRPKGRMVFVDFQQVGEDGYALVESTNVVLTKLVWKKKAIEKFMKRNPEALITIHYPHDSEDVDGS
jgi:hypothetical protein